MNPQGNNLVSLIFAAACLLMLPRIWRDEPFYAGTIRAMSFVLGETMLQVLERVMPASIVLFTAGSLVILFEPALKKSVGVDGYTVLASGVLIGWTLLLLSVGLFNWPKLIVPPPLRSQPGLITIWMAWYRRRRRSHPV